MKCSFVLKTGFAVAVTALLFGTAQADPVSFFGNSPDAGGVFPTSPDDPALQARLSFNTAVEVVQTETFESRAPVFLSTVGNQMDVLNAGSLTQAPPRVDAAGDPIDLGGAVITGSGNSGRFNTTTGGAQWFETDWSFSIALGGRFGAFGFFGTDFGDFDGSLEIDLYDGNTRVAENVFRDANNNNLPLMLTDPSVTDPNGSLLFFGYASSTLFDRIDFRVAQGGNVTPDNYDFLGFDDLMIGNLRTGGGGGTVPEPGSLALVGLALFAAGWARKGQRGA